tara:strand:- start:252 stop:746 length:495 start_codon:yes stop_codon:yes gene_type:complete
MSSKTAIALLNKQLLNINKNPIDGFSVGLVNDNIFHWKGTLIGPRDSLFDGGIFNVEMSFPDNFPLYPPKFKFITKIFHPNIYEDGTVCISILHPPGDDKYGYEDASDRWRPVHTIESIVISIISLLNSPNIESPANIDAGKLFRDDIKEYKKKVRKCVRNSLD